MSIRTTYEISDLNADHNTRGYIAIHKEFFYGSNNCTLGRVDEEKTMAFYQYKISDTMLSDGIEVAMVELHNEAAMEKEIAVSVQNSMLQVQESEDAQAVSFKKLQAPKDHPMIPGAAPEE